MDNSMTIWNVATIRTRTDKHNVDHTVIVLESGMAISIPSPICENMTMSMYMTDGKPRYWVRINPEQGE